MNNYDLTSKPLGYSYRAADRIWAGEYPVRDHNLYDRQRQLKILTDFGITCFVDLTEYGEMPPYAELLPPEARRESLPIANGMVPKDAGQVREMFARMAEVLEQSPSARIYIHCHGGVGRTGTIVACWYIFNEHLTADEALAKMRERFKGHGRSGWMKSPETDEQVAFIYEFENSRE